MLKLKLFKKNNLNCLKKIWCWLNEHPIQCDAKKSKETYDVYCTKNKNHFGKHYNYVTEDKW